jgi:PAS domain S-box-containing protein
MPSAHLRQLSFSLRLAIGLLLVPLAIAVYDLVGPNRGTAPWLRVPVLLVALAAVGVALRRHRLLQRRLDEAHRLEEERHASEAMLASVLGIAADAVITIDEGQRIIHFNRGAEEIFGWTSAEAMGNSLNVLLPERVRAAHGDFVRQFAHGAETSRRMGHRREVAGLRHDGSEFPAEASISKLTLPGGRNVFTAVVRDISERRRAQANEQFLAESGARLAASLEFAGVLQLIADAAVPMLADACIIDVAEGTEVFHRAASGPAAAGAALSTLVNEHRLSWDSPSAVIDVMRRGTPEIVPQADDDWLEAHEERSAALAAWRALGARSLLIVPLVVGRGTAAVRTLGALTLIAATPDRNFDADASALAEKYAVRAALAIENARLYREAQLATRARDDVLGVVSHDLRNPISAIAMCVSALREGEATSQEDRAELLTTIAQSADWMNRLIQDLLDVASLEAGRLSLDRRPQHPDAAIASAVRMFEVEAAQRGIELDTDVPEDLPAVLADGTRVVQVLGNLLRNAFQFSARGGRITVRAATGAQEMVFSVRDSGPGIPAAEQAVVFDRFWRSPASSGKRGAGLGLSIAKGIVEAHGGRIWVESTPGQGATFSFSLPIAGARELAAASPRM